MELVQKSDEDILKIANPIMANLMEASTEINHERHVADFTGRLKMIVTKEYFEKVCRQYLRKAILARERPLQSFGGPNPSRSYGSSGSRSSRVNLWRKWSWSRSIHGTWSTTSMVF